MSPDPSGSPPEIDPQKLRRVMMFDTSALVRALDSSSTESDAPAARALFDKILKSRDSRILVPAVGFAEFMRQPNRRLPRRRQVEIVSFGRDAAIECANHVPQTIPDGDPRPKPYWKVDALILGCALFEQVDIFVTSDKKQAKKARELGINTMAPMDFLLDERPAMMPLFDLLRP